MFHKRLNNQGGVILLDTLLAAAVAGLLIAQLFDDTTQHLRFFTYSRRQDQLAQAIESARDRIAIKLAELGCDQSFTLKDAYDFSLAVSCRMSESNPRSRLCLASCEVRSEDLRHRLPEKIIQLRKWSFDR